MINRDRLAALRKIEDERFLALHPKSGEMFKAGQKNMPGGVPMSWMAKWPGAYPVFVENAKGARFTDVDGNTYIDFCLGDTGSMTGHSPDATVAAIREQAGKGITAMLPTADAAIVSAELAARFGLPLWQFTVSATDANRHVIRYSRMITGRSKIVVIDRCYHGSVDETFATLNALETQWPAKEISAHLLLWIKQRELWNSTIFLAWKKLWHMVMLQRS
jgi:glutamate-1-semialdehyde 2,1-aminomutase